MSCTAECHCWYLSRSKYNFRICAAETQKQIISYIRTCVKIRAIFRIVICTDIKQRYITCPFGLDGLVEGELTVGWIYERILWTVDTWEDGRMDI